MSAPDPVKIRSSGARIALFRVLGGVLLAFAVLGVASVAVGVYFTLAESSSEGWFMPVVLGVCAVAVVSLGLAGYRALRIRTVAELEQQSRSPWLERLQSIGRVSEQKREK